MQLLKYRDCEVQVPGLFVAMAGEYRLQTMGPDGRLRWRTDWFSNNITDGGLDMATTDRLRLAACRVGTGNAAPANGDTSLQTFLAGTSAIGLLTDSGVSGEYSETYLRYDFATGAVVGNISEVCVAPSATSGQPVFSRELIRDGNGDPTTISVQVGETLFVHYRLRHYNPVADVSNTVTISGVDYDITRRAAFAGGGGWGITRTPFLSQGSVRMGVWDQDVQCRLFTDESLADLTAGPVGGAVSASTAYSGSYTPGSFQRQTVAEWDAGVATRSNNAMIEVFAGRDGVSLGNNYYSGGRFQILLTPAINKLSTYKLVLNFMHAWGRRP